MTHSYQGKRIAILGAGASGIAAARLGQQLGAKVCLFDSAPLDQIHGVPSDIPLQPEVQAHHACQFDPELVILSPGIPPTAPILGYFDQCKAQIIAEVEFAATQYQGTIVGITGTNGKTTTTELVQKLLVASGIDAQACGNYGIPFSEVVRLHPQSQAVALELSSFQLEAIRSLRPAIAIWLNFSADHLDRYPDIEAYRQAKQRIFLNQQSNDHAIFRVGEQIGSIKARPLTFSCEDRSADFYFDGQLIHHCGQPLLDFSTTKMRGSHNAENCMAAIAVIAALRNSPQLLANASFAQLELTACADAINQFAPPLHRCELIRILDQVEYINDSKATNLDALRCAVLALNAPIILLAGGKDKNLDFSPLLADLRGRVKHCLTFGEIQHQLVDTFTPAINTEATHTLNQAVNRAQQLASPGTIVLLSPGTSSYDQFQGYQHRGETFRQAVLNLK